MKQITQTELVNLIKAKQENAKNEYRRVSNDTGFRTLEESRIRIIRQEREKAFIDAYQDLLCYLDSVEIVPAQEYRETLFVNPLKVSNKGCVEENDIKTLFEKAPITPYIAPKVEQCEPAPEREDGKALLDSLCNKCGKTKEECPFHRMGSAYEDCSGFIEQKPHEIRNDRFREFERTNEDKTTTTATIDAKEISTMVVQKSCYNDTYEVLMVGNGGVLFFKRFIEEPRAKAYYEELLEWWKYWKQN